MNKIMTIWGILALLVVMGGLLWFGGAIMYQEYLEDPKRTLICGGLTLLTAPPLFYFWMKSGNNSHHGKF
jgi:hypothetical protein